MAINFNEISTTALVPTKDEVDNKIDKLSGIVPIGNLLKIANDGGVEDSGKSLDDISQEIQDETFPTYDGNNASYLEDTTPDEADSTKTYKDIGTHVWTAQRKCLAYLNLTGTSSQSVVRVAINIDPDLDTGYTHTVYRNL